MLRGAGGENGVRDGIGDEEGLSNHERTGAATLTQRCQTAARRTAAESTTTQPTADAAEAAVQPSGEGVATIIVVEAVVLIGRVRGVGSILTRLRPA